MQILMKLSKYKAYFSSLSTPKHKIAISICLLLWSIAIISLLRDNGIFVNNTIFLFLISVQLISAICDILTRTISLKLMLISALFCLLFYVLFTDMDMFFSKLLGGVIAFVITSIIVLASKRQFGGGDMALLTVTALFLGTVYFFKVLFVSIVMAGMYSLLLIFMKAGTKSTEIPFAPFILAATVILVLGF